MAQTLEQINALRRMKGEDPLTETPIEVDPNNPVVDENKPVTDAPKLEDNKEDVVAPEINDDAVLKYLQQKGLPVKSLDDLNKPITEDDLAKQAEDRESAKLTYGLNKGLFNRKTHEQYILDKNNKQQLVFAQFYQ